MSLYCWNCGSKSDDQPDLPLSNDLVEWKPCRCGHNQWVVLTPLASSVETSVPERQEIKEVQQRNFDLTDLTVVLMACAVLPLILFVWIWAISIGVDILDQADRQ